MAETQMDNAGNNKFQRVMLTAKRARELAEGINLLPDMEGKKITTVAMEELERGELKRDDQMEGGDKTGA